MRPYVVNSPLKTGRGFSRCRRRKVQMDCGASDEPGSGGKCHPLAPIVVPVVVAPAVPTMVVAELAVVAVPVAFKVELAIMTRLHPMCAGVSGTGPVSVVPFIVVAHRVPVAPYPGIA